MINKSIPTKGVTCSKVELDDLFNAEEPNDESYHDNTMKAKMNLEKTELRKIVIYMIIIDGQLEVKSHMTLLKKMSLSDIRNKTTCFSYRRTHC